MRKDAIVALQKALRVLREATEADLRKQVGEAKNPITLLMDIIYGNPGTWSGGPTYPTNIVEAVTRSVAIELLDELARREPTL